jgi:hypothetical protein
LLAEKSISIELPADPATLRLVRLIATFVGSQADLSVEDVDDLRLAADELCQLLLSQAGDDPGQFAVRYWWTQDAVELSCAVAPRPPREHLSKDSKLEVLKSPHNLSHQILAALVDDHSIVSSEPTLKGWMRKRRTRVGAR